MREFKLENEYPYNRRGPARWIISHTFRYPLLPLLTLLAAVINNYAYSYVQVFIGRAFDLINQLEWPNHDLWLLALGTFAAASTQGVLGLVRNYANEYAAQRIERDARDELYASLLGKSQTFHGKQRIGDVMARATNDVRSLNIMFSPGLMLILDASMGVIAPITLIAAMEPRLLLVPGLFLITLVITVTDYARRLNPVSDALREQFGAMNAGLAEAIAGVEVVKGHAQEEQELRKFA
ncbi:MAG: hypothetical protein KC443_25315, partial [Anaerolineales bacterium]|nr:hypothetical protein [Anaerolineales bacterium]